MRRAAMTLAAAFAAIGIVALPSCELAGSDVSDERCETVAAALEELDAVADAALVHPDMTDADREWLDQAARVAILAWATCEHLGGTTTSTTTDTTSTTVPETTTTTHPGPHHPGLPVDEDALTDPAPALGVERIVCGNTGQPPPGAGCGTSSPVGDGTAAFRTNCATSHQSFDDPIGAPGQPGASHLHTFWGNADADADSTTMDVGGSTCDGGTANRTGYWMPAMLDTRTDRPVTTWQGLGNTAGEGNEFGMQVYYKSGYQGVFPPSRITQWFPPGLRILVGSADRSTPTGPSAPGGFPPIQYACTHPNAIVIPNDAPQAIPHCDPTNPNQRLLQSIVRFPQCWVGPAGDNPATPGRNEALDPPDHRSHMAYSTPGVGCPATHPVPLPEITMHERIMVQVGDDTRHWARASDSYLAGQAGPFTNAGLSLHADWWNGWGRGAATGNSEDFGATIIANCYQPAGGRDCGFSLGDGRELWQ